MNQKVIFFPLCLFQYPLPLIKRAWELGLINTHIPESCGKKTCFLISRAKQGQVLYEMYVCDYGFCIEETVACWNNLKAGDTCKCYEGWM